MASNLHFHWIDYLIFGITLLISLAIGLYYGFKGQKTTSQFLLGGRNMPVIPTSLSLLVSFLSGVMILGYSSETYMRGTTIFWHIAGDVLGLTLAALLFQPIFYKLQLTSVYEYLELRFHSRMIRLLGSCLFIISVLIYMAIVLYAPALALNAVSGVQLELLIVISGLVCTIYTTLGGLKAVVWTDAFQALLMYVGLIAIVIQGTIRIGSISKAWQIAEEGGRIVTNFSPDPFEYMTFWSVFIGTAINRMGVYGVSQTSVQRYVSLSTQRKAQLSLLLVIPGNLTLIPLVVMCGLVIYAYYAYCDPLMLGVISKRDQLVPYFTVDVLAEIRGLPGIFLACLYSGTLSSVSSGINSLAAVVWKDFLKPAIGSKISEDRATLITKLIGCIFGIIAIGLGMLAQYFGHVLKAALTVLNVFHGPLAGLFLFGILFPWAEKYGALSGVLTGCFVTGWICLGADIIRPYRSSLPRTIIGCTNETFVAAGFTNHSNIVFNSTKVSDVPLSGIKYIYKLSYMLYGCVGLILVFVVGIPISLAISKFKFNSDDVQYMWSGFGYCCKTKFAQVGPADDRYVYFFL